MTGILTAIGACTLTYWFARLMYEVLIYTQSPAIRQMDREMAAERRRLKYGPDRMT